LKKLRHIYSIAYAHKRIYLLTAFSVLITWVGAFLIPVYYSPTIPVFTMILVIGLCRAFSTYRRKPTILHAFSFVSLLLLMLAFYAFYFHYFPFTKFILMCIATFATGLFGYFYIIHSLRLSYCGLSSSAIMAIRSWPLFIGSLFVALANHPHFSVPSLNFCGEMLLVSTFSFIIPLYFGQKSIHAIKAERHSLLMCFLPILTYLLEKWLLKSGDNTLGVFSSILFLIILLPSVIQLKMRYNRPTKEGL
jgi:hypothetical protein